MSIRTPPDTQSNPVPENGKPVNHSSLISPRLELRGLTDEEVRLRQVRGLQNTVSVSSTRPYRIILRQNAFTLINLVLYLTFVALVVMGLYGDAFLTVFLAVFNVAISVVQEVRTKRTLDRISLLTWPQVTVIRNGELLPVDPTRLVQGDLLVLQPGEQAVVDGELLEASGLEVDESLLTGEADPVSKRAGDSMFSGTVCVAGTGTYRADKVGSGSVASRLTTGARKFRQIKTPLQRDMETIVRLMVLSVVLIGGPVVMDLAVRTVEVAIRWLDVPFSDAVHRVYASYPVESTVRSAAVIIALIPQGLALMVSVTYAAGALRLAGSGILIQQTNAMESLSHINVLCLDKTGTLTTNRLELVDVLPINADEDSLRIYLGDFGASSISANKTIDAIVQTLPGRIRPPVGVVAFSSERKWSSLAFDDSIGRGLFVLGAPDVLGTAVGGTQQFADTIAEWTSLGKRVLLLASHPDPYAIAEGPVLLPPDLIPLGLISFTDGMRVQSKETIRHFADRGVRLKFISGDDPRTVEALVRLAGFSVEGRAVSGIDLEALNDDELSDIANEASVFGRTTPIQKERLIDAMQKRGNYVAMIGDGVNDVPALKQAQVGIAMRSGSAAARGVADLVLLDDSFGSLPSAFSEGQRIVTAMHDIASLFFARSLSVMLILLGAALVAAPFPVTPRHNALLALVTVGIPTLGLAAWARPRPSPGRLLPAIVRFSLPAALTVAPISLMVYLLTWRLTEDVDESRTVLTATAAVCGLLLLPFAQPPGKFFVASDRLGDDKRPLLLSIVLFAGAVVIFATGGLRSLFELTNLDGFNVLLIAAAVVAWIALVRPVWKYRLIERVAGLENRSN